MISCSTEIKLVLIVFEQDIIGKIDDVMFCVLENCW